MPWGEVSGAQRAAMHLAEQGEAGIDRRAGAGGLLQHHGAGAAIALVAAFLGTGAAGVLTQPGQHRGGGLHAADRDDGATVHEADGAGGICSLGHTRKIAAHTGSGIRWDE